MAIQERGGGLIVLTLVGRGTVGCRLIKEGDIREGHVHILGIGRGRDQDLGIGRGRVQDPGVARDHDHNPKLERGHAHDVGVEQAPGIGSDHVPDARVKGHIQRSLTLKEPLVQGLKKSLEIRGEC